MSTKEKVIIATVGGTIEPILISIEEYNPDFIIFIHSKGSKNNVSEILEKLDYDFRYECIEIDNHQIIQDTYDVTDKILNDLDEKKQEILVNFTGGTKAMVGGIVLATIDSDVKSDLIYVGTKEKDGRDKNGTGVVKTGKEVIIEQINPFEFYAVKEFKKGKRFFDSYQFSISLRDFKEAEYKSNDPKFIELAKFYTKLVMLYDKWDKFSRDVVFFNEKYNYEETLFLSKFLKEYILDDINRNKYILEDKKVNNGFYNQLEKNYLFLREKISAKNRYIGRNINYYLADLLNNANRRIEEGKYDDAVARLYRAIELIAQIKLYNLNLINQDRLKENLIFHISKANLNKLIEDNEELEEVKGWYEYDTDSEFIKIPLTKSYTLLSLLGDDLAKEYLEDKNLIFYINKRNNSILAHGLTSITSDDAKKLFKYVSNYAFKFDSELNEKMDLAKFPKFGV